MLRVFVVAWLAAGLWIHASTGVAYAASPKLALLKLKAPDRKTIYCNINSNSGYAGKKKGRKFVPFSRETNDLARKVSRSKPKKRAKLEAKLNKLQARYAGYENICKAALGIVDAHTSAPVLEPAPTDPVATPTPPPIVRREPRPPLRIAAPDLYILPDGVDSQGQPYNGQVYLGQSSPNGFDVNNSFIEAHVVYVGDERWQLQIRAKKPLKQIAFPWQNEARPLPSAATGTNGESIAYYPYWMGVTEKASNRNSGWAWMADYQYPGSASAPLIVVANRAEAQIVAATNWPPKRVTPGYVSDRLALFYNTPLAANESDTFEALVADVQADPAYADVPWQLALDKYRAWLDTKVAPPTYPEWLQNIHGWLAIGLSNYLTFDIRDVEARWNRWKGIFPWVQFWGQMAAYNTGCCSLSQTMHPRYAGVREFAASVKNNPAGYHVGFYSAPHYDPKKPLDTAEGRSWFFGWLNQNLQYNANAFYYDVLAADDWGDPETMLAGNIMGGLSKDAVMEKVIDIYPGASLISGSLNGGDFNGGPGKTPENRVSTTFPRFLRYLYGDRIVFLGESNGDYAFWGNGNNNWTERQAFLLGAKFDAGHPSEWATIDVLNPALTMAISERNRVNFWARRPVYLDTMGLSQIPAGIEVRRFRDSAGKTLLAVDNWSGISGASVLVDGLRVNIPAAKLSLVDVSVN